MITALLMLLTPEGAGKKVLAFACGTVLVLVLISPFRDISAAELSNRITELTGLADNFAADTQSISEDVQKEILKERVEAYILDKAKDNQIDCTVKADLEKDKDGQYVVAAVTITLKTAGETVPEAFAREVREELGLPEGQPVLRTEGDDG